MAALGLVDLAPKVGMSAANSGQLWALATVCDRTATLRARQLRSRANGQSGPTSVARRAER